MSMPSFCRGIAGEALPSRVNCALRPGSVPSATPTPEIWASARGATAMAAVTATPVVITLRREISGPLLMASVGALPLRLLNQTNLVTQRRGDVQCDARNWLSFRGRHE